MAINPTQALIAALEAIKDSDPRETDCLLVVGLAEPTSIFHQVKAHFNYFVGATKLEFGWEGERDRNRAAINCIIWLLSHGALELPSDCELDLEVMKLAGARFQAEYWLSAARKRIADLEAELAKLPPAADPS